ncbi:GntR family transcriptional regulator [Sulfidibacter corallicola]|uniref:GntR family transcriptional regulator n=1 Tax=Sulfidibacter corallicola TaxID=2818388 RepID=A0A8A4TNC4_SULCO|nr:GntR family transcriptional regulator [Sulfidibacter corallicola]QTD50602.1 GntR family transcriptional regulator [Sulfidibacter corallicola]
MHISWNDNIPIYIQLRDHMIALILSGAVAEGEALPSVRTVAADFRLNPITVSKAFQLLVETGLVEKRRGRGMFVAEGAHRQLLAAERAKFLTEEWPAIVSRIRQLGLDPAELLESVGQPKGDTPS